MTVTMTLEEYEDLENNKRAFKHLLDETILYIDDRDNRFLFKDYTDKYEYVKRELQARVRDREIK